MQVVKDNIFTFQKRDIYDIHDRNKSTIISYEYVEVTPDRNYSEEFNGKNVH